MSLIKWRVSIDAGGLGLLSSNSLCVLQKNQKKTKGKGEAAGGNRKTAEAVNTHEKGAAQKEPFLYSSAN